MTDAPEELNFLIMDLRVVWQPIWGRSRIAAVSPAALWIISPLFYYNVTYQCYQSVKLKKCNVNIFIKTITSSLRAWLYTLLTLENVNLFDFE